MKFTVPMDNNGRLVLPKAVRQRLNLTGGARFQIDVLAGRIELTPIEAAGEAVLLRKDGIRVLARVNATVDVAGAVAAERGALEERGRRR